MVAVDGRLDDLLKEVVDTVITEPMAFLVSCHARQADGFVVMSNHYWVIVTVLDSSWRATEEIRPTEPGFLRC